MWKAKIGSIWEGKYEHQRDRLIKAMLDEVAALDQDAAFKLQTEHYLAFMHMDAMDETGLSVLNYEEPGLADEFIEAMRLVLDEHAPQYCYFGEGEDGNEGEGWGFWIDDDRLKDAIHDGEAMQTNEGSIPSFILDISDHGNMTLLRVTTEEVW